MLQLPYSLMALALLAILAATLLTLHKVRKVHQASFRLVEDSRRILDDLAETKRETLSLFRQLQALHALERRLGLPEPLPLMRGWAGSPDFLLCLANELLATLPGTVMECSSGVSTVVAARCMQLNGHGHVYSLEHEADYAERTRELLRRHGLEAWATVIDAPLVRQDSTLWYSLDGLPGSLTAIDVLVVDGPPYFVDTLARYPALPRLLPRMASDAVVFLDDANREAEREIVARWTREFPGLTVQTEDCEKGLAVIRVRRPVSPEPGEFSSPAPVDDGRATS